MWPWTSHFISLASGFLSACDMGRIEALVLWPLSCGGLAPAHASHQEPVVKFLVASLAGLCHLGSLKWLSQKCYSVEIANTVSRGSPRSSDIPQRPLLSGPLSLVLHPPPPATGRRVLSPRVSGTSHRAPVPSPRFVTTTMMTKVVMSK